MQFPASTVEIACNKTRKAEHGSKLSIGCGAAACAERKPTRRLHPNGRKVPNSDILAAGWRVRATAGAAATGSA